MLKSLQLLSIVGLAALPVACSVKESSSARKPASRVAGSSQIESSGVCDENPLELKLLPNGSFVLKSTSENAFDKARGLTGNYYLTANENEIELYDGFFVEDGQPGEQSHSIMTCSLPGSGRSFSCLVTTQSQARIGCMDIDFELE